VLEEDAPDLSIVSGLPWNECADTGRLAPTPPP